MWTVTATRAVGDPTLSLFGIGTEATARRANGEITDSHDVIGGGGITLHVETTGPKSGQAILFINGYSTSGRGWIHQLDSDLGDDYRLVTLDTRGHGRSDKPQDAYDDPQLWASDIQAVIDHLELDAPVLVASSLAGVPLCDYLAIHGEDDIAGINMVGAISTVGTEDARIKTGGDFLELIPALESTVSEESITAINELWRRIPHDSLPTRDHYYMVGVTAQTPPYVRRKLLRRTVLHDDLHPSIKSPVLITHGQEDTIVLPEAAKEHAEAIPNARTSFYPEIGHTPFLETPARFNRELREFVDSL